MNKYNIGDVVRIIDDTNNSIGIVVGVEFVIRYGYDYTVLVETEPESIIRYAEDRITQDRGVCD